MQWFPKRGEQGLVMICVSFQIKKGTRRIVSSLVTSFMISLTFVKGLLGALRWCWGHQVEERLVPGRRCTNYWQTIWWICSNTWSSTQARSWLRVEQGRSGEAIRRDLEIGQRYKICVNRFHCPQRKLFLDGGMFQPILRKTQRDSNTVSTFLPFTQNMQRKKIQARNTWPDSPFCEGAMCLSAQVRGFHHPLLGDLQQLLVGFERKTHLPDPESPAGTNTQLSLAFSLVFIISLITASIYWVLTMCRHCAQPLSIAHLILPTILGSRCHFTQFSEDKLSPRVLNQLSQVTWLT